MSDEEDEHDSVEDCDMPMPPPGARRHRNSVSAEAWQAAIEYFEPPKHPKTPEQMARIRQLISAKSFLFSSLDDNDLVVVIEAMSMKMATPQECLVREGDEGHCVYCVDTGFLNVWKNVPDSPAVIVKVLTEGDIFGELSLLYNAPRAATVVAETDCILWELDRDTFSHLVKNAAQQKRRQHDSFLKNVPLLASLDDYERLQIADALEVRNEAAGTLIIRQGDSGDYFFLIQEGACEAQKVEGADVQTMHLGPSDYFGELALLNDAQRAANVTSLTDVKLLCLDRTTFQRLLGPLEEHMAQHAARYATAS